MRGLIDLTRKAVNGHDSDKFTCIWVITTFKVEVEIAAYCDWTRKGGDLVKDDREFFKEYGSDITSTVNHQKQARRRRDGSTKTDAFKRDRAETELKYTQRNTY